MTGVRQRSGVVNDVHRQLVDTECLAREPGSMRTHARELARRAEPLISNVDIECIVEDVMARVDGLGVIEPLMRRGDVSEIMVNPDGSVWCEIDGRVTRWDLHLEAATTMHLINAIVGPLGRRVDRASPLVDARLTDGSRIHAAVPPISIDGPCLTIRRFRRLPLTLADMAEPDLAAVLSTAVRDRRNILVAGGTGSGKTTLLNVLGRLVGQSERIVTVEDVAELTLGVSNVVRLEARADNAEGAGRITIRELVRNALRMRPDRIIVGEVRGAEAFDMVQAMNTGHPGSMSTLHANSPVDALRRLETMVLIAGEGLPLVAVRQQIASAIDIVVFVERLPSGSRRVREVATMAQLVGQWYS